MFWAAIRPVLTDNTEALTRLDRIRDGFAQAMSQDIEAMWTKKLGLINYDATVVKELLELMVLSKVDYTIFFRKLSDIPDQLSVLKESFYLPSSEQLDAQWDNWLQRWSERINSRGDLRVISESMQAINPKYAWREWLISPAYKKAEQGEYSYIKELQAVFCNPYKEQSPEVQRKYDRLTPKKFFKA